MDLSQSTIHWYIMKLNSLPRLLTTLKWRAFENIVGKGKNADYLQFLLFPQCFLSFSNQISIFHSHLFCHHANAFNLNQSKFLSFGKELNLSIDSSHSEYHNYRYRLIYHYITFILSSITLTLLCIQTDLWPFVDTQQHSRL